MAEIAENRFKYQVYTLDGEFQVVVHDLDTLSSIVKVSKNALAKMFISRSGIFTGVKDHKVFRETVPVNLGRDRKIYNIYDSKKEKVKTCYSLKEVADFLLISTSTVLNRIPREGRVVGRSYNVHLGYFMDIAWGKKEK